MTHISGEYVKCECCGIPYIYFVWSLGSESALCRKCVRKRPQASLDCDPVDLIKEQEDIMTEVQESEDKECPKKVMKPQRRR